MLRKKFILEACKLATCILLLFAMSTAYGHGSPTPSLQKEKHIEHERIAPKVIGVIPESDVDRFLVEKSIPNDVVLVKCQLAGVSICRGFEVALYDSKGNEQLVGNTGMSGLVGIEGLSPENRYKLAIRHTRYQAETAGTPGNFILLRAEDKTFQ